MPFAAVAGVASAVGQYVVASDTADAQKSAINQGKSEANSYLSPFTNAGTNALTQYTNIMGLNGSDAATSAMGSFTASPGYSYNVSEGLKAVDQGAAAKGLLRSGATLKAEETLGANLANQDFSNYLSRLSGLTSTGLTAASGQANVATGAASNTASVEGSLGKSTAAAVNTGTNSLTDALSGYFKSGSSGSVYPTGANADGSYSV